MKLYFRTKEEALVFQTPLQNLGMHGHDPVPSTDNRFWEWQMEIDCTKSQETKVRAMNEAYRWGVSHGKGEYGWSDVQGRCTGKGGTQNPDYPLGSRVRRISHDEGRPNPQVNAQGTVIGQNGPHCIIIQFDGVTYPRPQNTSLGDWLFLEEIERI